MTNTDASQPQSAPPDEWRRYPYAIGRADPELVFPQAEGDQAAESNTYYVAGRLRGRSGRQWAFLTIFCFNNVWRRLRADFHTLALFDLDAGTYGTHTEFDLPHPFRRRKQYRLSVATGHLDVAFRGVIGESSWRTRRADNGSLVPFAYDLDLHGVDQRGRRMDLRLALDCRKPPMPVGGAEYGGLKTCIGQYGTHSYLQSDVRFTGRLGWGDVAEDVEGDCGWIDRQWAPRYLGVHNGLRATRYAHEWREIHLDNGVELSVWLHFDRRRHDRIVPFAGATAVGPEHELAATTELTLDRLSFVRDPRTIEPLRRIGSGGAYFTDRYRLHVPEWDLELFSEPLVPAPAHRLPIEYWSGPTRITGALAGRAVTGFGFHERTMPFIRDFELVEVLRSTVRHLPPAAFDAGSPGPLGLANLVWEIDGFLSHGDYQAALHYLARRIRPEIDRLHEPHRATVAAIADDVAESLLRYWVRP
jgi:predicted secreted hydrolase